MGYFRLSVEDHLETITRPPRGASGYDSNSKSNAMIEDAGEGGSGSFRNFVTSSDNNKRSKRANAWPVAAAPESPRSAANMIELGRARSTVFGVTVVQAAGLLVLITVVVFARRKRRSGSSTGNFSLAAARSSYSSSWYCCCRRC